MVRKRAVDAQTSADPAFLHWKGRFKAATVAVEQGKLDEARTAVFRCLFEAESLDERDFAVPASNLGIAVISMMQGKHKESKEYFDKGLSALANRSDPPSREIQAAGLRFLAQWYEQEGNLNESESCLRESVQILEDLNYEDSTAQLAYSLCDYAFILIRLERVAEAEEQLKRAMDLLKSQVGREDPSYDWAKFLYEVCLNQHDKQVLSEVLEAGVSQYEYKVGDKHPNLIRALSAYAAALKKNGMDDKLAEARTRFGALLA